MVSLLRETTYKNGTGGGEAEEPVTGLKDGILTITKEHRGVKEEGWSWNGWRLDINDKFDGNKQIVFADGVMPTIKVNQSSYHYSRSRTAWEHRSGRPYHDSI
mgnify:CR=1 FL=1